MLFNSFVFIFFLFITFILYYLPALKKYQVQILIIASLIFYSYSQPALLSLLLISAFINIATSYLIVHAKRQARFLYALLGVGFNLLVLIFFKYSPLFATTFLNTETNIGHILLMLPLPIGISFYTFEGISLLVDVYSNRHSDVLTVDRSFSRHTFKTLFFISFFPHLISGPILKAYEFYPQIGNKRYSDIDWTYVVKKLIAGYFLKMVVADNLTNLTFWMSYPYFRSQSSLDLVMMVFAYSCQIFADFAGYSLIALGLAKLFGYNLIENFNFPYISASFSDFWRRWHISLSTFLKEYLYIPLGGNRNGKTRTYLNLIITMTLGGLWHGAAWSYAVWGLVHGLALAIERLIAKKKHNNPPNHVVKSLKTLGVFCFVSMAWILFKLSFSEVIEYGKAFSSNFTVKPDKVKILLIGVYSLPVIIYHSLYLLNRKKAYAEIIGKYDFIAYAILLFLIITNSGPSGSFIYFQF